MTNILVSDEHPETKNIDIKKVQKYQQTNYTLHFLKNSFYLEQQLKNVHLEKILWA